MTIARFHEPLAALDPKTGEPYLQVPCDRESCSSDDHDLTCVTTACHADPHHEVQVVGRSGQTVFGCPEGHVVHAVTFFALTPIDGLAVPRCPTCDRELDKVAGDDYPIPIV